MIISPSVLSLHYDNFINSSLYEWLITMHKNKEHGDVLFLDYLISKISNQLMSALNESWVNYTKTIEKTLTQYREISKKYSDIQSFLFDCATHKNDSFAAFYEQSFKVLSTAPKGESGVVTISTIHSAKGLEWENVFVSSVYNKNLPSFRCYKNNIIDINAKEFNEDMKKYYVAVTRSSKNIYITYPRISYGKFGTLYNEKSIFVNIDPIKM